VNSGEIRNLAYRRREGVQGAKPGASFHNGPFTTRGSPGTATSWLLDSLLELLVLLPRLNQRLINQVRKPLEEAVLVVWEVLGKDEHDELFSRIDHA